MAKRCYVVNHGDDYSNDYFSTVKREARKIATELHRKYPGEEIRICYCTTEDDFCEKEVVIYEKSTVNPKFFYGLEYSSDFALNDSVEKIKQWGTASLVEFKTKEDRDKWEEESHLNRSISLKKAKMLG